VGGAVGHISGKQALGCCLLPAPVGLLLFLLSRRFV
jgi:hypothetical protein